MNAGRSGRMAEATRLTRLGRLREAMEVLRGVARPAPATAAAAAAERRQWNHVSGTAQQTPGVLRAPGSVLERLRRVLPGAPARLDVQVPAGRATVVDPPARPGTFDWHTHRGRSGSRRYRLYVPTGFADRALPMLVMLHGCKQDPDDFAAGTRMNQLAQDKGLLVVYPEQPGHANAARCWNWFNPADQQRDRGEPELIAGIAREVMASRGADASRVYVAGLSAGGAAAAVLATAYPDLFAAAGVHSGLACGAARDVPSALQAMRSGTQSPDPGQLPAADSAPLIVFHGDRDRTVHPTNAQHVVGQVTRQEPELGVRSERGKSDGGVAYTRSIHSDRGGRTRVEHWLLHGSGHAWSGGDPAGSYTDPRGPDASAEMLRFFGAHTLRHG